MMSLEEILMKRCFISSGFQDPNYCYMTHYDGSITINYFLMRTYQHFGLELDIREVVEKAISSPLLRYIPEGGRYHLNFTS